MAFAVSYQLASDAQYRFDIVKIGRHEYDHLAYYFKENFPDVKITRKQLEMDIPKLQATTLWTVNGYVQTTITDGENLYIPGVVAGMLHSRSNKVGMLTFNGLTAGLKKHPIAATQVTADVNIPAYEKVFITFEEAVVSPILVMAGYLIFENQEFFYRISDHTFALHLHRLNYMEKLYELSHYREIFKELEIPTSPNNPTQVDAKDALSETTIKKFLSLPNSFVVDTGHPQGLVTQPIYLEHSNIPGNFRTHKLPTLPMFVGFGKLTEYHKNRINDNRYSVYTQDTIYNNYIFSATNHHLVQSYNGHRIPNSTYRISQGFFLDIRERQ